MKKKHWDYLLTFSSYGTTGSHQNLWETLMDYRKFKFYHVNLGNNDKTY